jgi:hypothetical protein
MDKFLREYLYKKVLYIIYEYFIIKILKLSIPNTYLWIGMFFSLFHLWLNITSEILRFAGFTIINEFINNNYF